MKIHEAFHSLKLKKLIKKKLDNKFQSPKLKRDSGIMVGLINSMCVRSGCVVAASPACPVFWPLPMGPRQPLPAKLATEFVSRPQA